MTKQNGALLLLLILAFCGRIVAADRPNLVFILTDNQGAWTLGEGFSSWVTKPDGSTREFYDQDIIENGQVRREPGYTTDLWTRKGVEFIERNRERPFCLFLAYNGPYALGSLMLNSARNRHAAYYADQDLPSFPRDAMHPWQFHNKLA